MVSSGYMIELDFESIWDAEIETARFAKINVRLGGILNYFFTRDAATDITDTRIVPLLVQFSEEALMNLLNGAKANKFTDVWQFINANASMIMSRILAENPTIVDMIKKDLSNEKMELTRVTLPSSTTNW